MRVLIVFFMALFFFIRPVSAQFVAYNDNVDTVSSTTVANVTHYSGLSGASSGGFLTDFGTGLSTTVNVSLAAVNANAEAWGAMPTTGTDAYNVFNGIVDLSGVASYGSGLANWSYEITFTGLDTTKQYEFVTTANRGNSAYGESGTDPRWTQFSIFGADTFTNSSSSGVEEIFSPSPDVLRMNTGDNTTNGYIISWSGITSSTGSFSVRSENDPFGPGNAYKSYGFQAFKLAETAPPVVPEPVSSTLFIVGGMALGMRRFMKKRNA